MAMEFSGTRWVLGLAGCCLVAGCATIGPDYTAAQIGVAEHWQADMNGMCQQ